MHGLKSVLLIVLIKGIESDKRRNDPESLFRGPRSIRKSDDDIAERPVPFGHIYKEGFGDIGGLKAPIDFLELNVRHPMESEEARELLKTTNPKNVQFYERFVQAKGYTNPRDKILKDLGVIDNTGPEINETQFKWYNLADLQAKNVEIQPVTPSRRYTPRNREEIESQPRAERFINKTFTPSNDYDIVEPNFTKCDEFGSRAHFHPNDVVDLNWVPFYVWCPERQTRAIIHTFNYATKKLVQSVRELYRKFLQINWEQPKLVYHGVGNYLLIAVDKKGLFHALQIVDSPPVEVVGSVPYTQLRLKIEEPYLVMLYCTDYFGAVMAVSGTEPSTDKEKKEEAETVGIVGTGWPVSRDLLAEKQEEKALRNAQLLKKQKEQKG